MKTKFLRVALCVLLFGWLVGTAWADSTKNPTGPTGEFNGSITTGGSIDPYTGNAKRFITDISVTGAVGAYPLAWTRVLNTRGGGIEYLGAGGQWAHSYQWGLYLVRNPPSDWQDPEGGEYSGPAGYIKYPDGRSVTLTTGDFVNYEPIQPFDGADRIVPAGGDDYTLLLRDGGRVEFKSYAGAPSRGSLQPTQIIDPHGLVTNLSYDSSSHLLVKVQEPAGRYLQINWLDKSYWRQINNQWVFIGIYLIDNVQAFAAPGNLVETVNYVYQEETIADQWGWLRTYTLTHANYDGGTHADYVYYPYSLGTGGHAVPAQIKSCNDVRFDGPMKQIEYEYLTGLSSPDGVVTKEKNFTTGQTVAEVIYPANCFNPPSNDPVYQSRTERRPDGSTRTFHYSVIGELESYTDFQNHSSSIAEGFAPGLYNYYKLLSNARGKTTTIEKEPLADQPIRIYEPDTSSPKTFSYYYLNPSTGLPATSMDGIPYYVQVQGDELGRNIYYTRDTGNGSVRGTYRVTKIWYGYDSTDLEKYPTEGFTYNSFGQIETHKLTTGGTENFRYDGRGLKIQSWPPATPGDLHPDQHKTEYFYYQTGPNTDRLWYVKDPRHNRTWFEYNQRGQITKVTHEDGTYTQSDYNADGTLAWTADENHPGAVNDPSQRTRYEYDDYKRVTKVTNPMGEFSTNSYAPWNGSGALSHTTSSVYRVTSPMLKKTDFDYDENFRVKMVRKGAESVDDDGGTWSTYDEVGNLHTVTDPRGKTTTFEYDGRNRKIWMTDAITTDRNPVTGHTMDWEYDDAGNKKKEIRADNAFRTWEYEPINPMGRLTKAIDWRMSTAETPVTTTYTYDRPDPQNMTVEHVIDAKNADYKFTFDALHRKFSEAYPPAAGNPNPIEYFVYDEAGNLMQYYSPAGPIKTMGYDNRNRLTVSWWNDDSTPTVTRVYDPASRLIDIFTGASETDVAFGYDDANRKIWENQTLAGYPTRHVETLRDADGNRSDLWVSTNGQAQYGLFYCYTERNQLSRITGGDNTAIASFVYDVAGNMTRRVGEWFYANGTWLTYDGLNRPDTADQGDATAFFQHNHYQYDNVGREVATWRDEDGKGEHFWYSAANHLTRVVYKANNAWTSNPSSWDTFRDYNYSADMLNWTSVNANGYLSIREHDDLNHYTKANTVPISYDRNFNQTTNYYGQTFVYNSENQVISGHIECTYDGLGRCVRRKVGGVTTLFTYDDWNQIVEWDQGGSLTARNIYGAGADEILGRYDAVGGRPLIYKLDKQGNVAFLLDIGNRVIEKYTYDAFGRPTVTSWDYNTNSWKVPSDRSSFGNRFMFTGREWLADINAYDYRHRLYDPDLGRFLQTDPKGFDAGDMNLFRYCGDDPVDLSDPMGLVAAENGAGRSFATGLAAFDGQRQWATVDVADLENLSRKPAGMDGGSHDHHVMGERITKDWASVEFVPTNPRYIPAEEIPKQKDPGVDERTRSYTLPVMGRSKVYTDRVTGKTNVVIPVYGKQVLPRETRIHDSKERSQLLRLHLSVFKADFAVRDIAEKGFSSPEAGAAAVRQKAMEIIKRENTRIIMDTDVLQRW